MSLLRNVLRKNTATSQDLESATGLSEKSRKGFLSSTLRKSADAISVKSSGGVTVHSVRSIAESVSSFTSTLFGGQRVPKRRRPEISRLGVPKWYDKNPPEPPEVPGAEKTDIANTSYTSAHSFTQKRPDGAEDSPYMSLVLYNYASASIQSARYFEETPIRGELRINLPNTVSISSIDVWCIGHAESVLSVSGTPLVYYHVNVWNRSKGNPVNPSSVVAPYRGDFPKGTFFVFPFEFPPLPKDAKVNRPDSSVVARVRLPPSFYYKEVGHFSGEVKYYIGVNIKRDGMLSHDDEWDVPFIYNPLRRPILREPTLFPFISDREDWPFDRQEIGGWTITPFGSRGRFRNEVVEIEGLLGVQAPAVYAPGQQLRYGLLLWSKSIPALEALSDLSQADIDVVFVRANLFGTDVLQPRNSARKNRRLRRLAQGRIWRTDDGPPETDEMPTLREEPKVASGSSNIKAETSSSSGTQKSSGSSPKSPTSPISSKKSRFQDVVTADDIQAEELVDVTGQIEKVHEEADPHILVSPGGGSDDDDGEDDTPFHDPDDFPELERLEATVRLDGDVQIPRNLVPSFRYSWLGCEYLLKITLQHPEYSHISPSGPGIYTETPIWVVLGNPVPDGPKPQETAASSPRAESNFEEYLCSLPMSGEDMPVPKDAVRAPLAKGAATTKLRPTKRGARIITF